VRGNPHPYRDCGFRPLGNQNHTGKNACITKSLFFLRAAKIFSCRNWELVELMDTGPGGRQNGNQDDASRGGHLIAVSPLYFLEEAVRP